jgi:hypothetical protein
LGLRSAWIQPLPLGLPAQRSIGCREGGGTMALAGTATPRTQGCEHRISAIIG